MLPGRTAGPGVLLSNASITAAATLNWLLDQAKSEHVKKDVAVTLLGYSGIHSTVASGPVVNIGIGGAVGYVIDLSGSPSRPDELPAIGPAGGMIYDREPAAVIEPGADDRSSSDVPVLSEAYRK